jgi:hypothetical protein
MYSRIVYSLKKIVIDAFTNIVIEKNIVIDVFTNIIIEKNSH